ncbi:MAG: hypothetical protein HGB21_09095 [Nitrospirae bacterium]|nr:hypothetical protein [Nitrospirota bacterium]
MLLLFATLTLLCVCIPGVTQATTLTVSKICSSPSSTTCFTTITAAINAAANNTTNDNIIIEPGTYTESITLINNLPISGVETARTILKNPSTSPVITANGLTNVSITNLTISSTSVGIQAVNSAVKISNNIFWGSSQGTAIQIQQNSSGEITNNTFFQNQTAISSQVDITIQNNIFSSNTTVLSAVSPVAQFTKVTYNDFYIYSNLGPFPYVPNDPLETNIPNLTFTDANPKFVNPNTTPPDMDLHLQETSPCIGTGFSAVDLGAFGGSGADTIPFMASGVTLTSQSGSGSVTVNWLPNKSYNVTNSDPTKRGGYNVHYSLNKSGPLYDAKATVASTTTSAVLSGLTTTASPPATPTLALTGFASNTLLLSWTTSTSDTKYIVYYTDTTAATPEQSKEVPAPVTFPYVLNGLENLHHYSVEVTAVAQPIYHFSVTVFDYTVAGVNGGIPGVAHESNYSSDIKLAIGSAVESVRSNALDPADTYPEAVDPYPALPNKGCFIATAAYGSYSASEVQALRAFRDRYLLTNGPGKAFVSWYNTYGPTGAQFLNDHPEWKPLVRAALLPAVGVAMFLMHTSSLTKAIVLLIGLSLVLMLVKNKLTSSGGIQ